jgi:hypothetical protein
MSSGGDGSKMAINPLTSRTLPDVGQKMGAGRLTNAQRCETARGADFTEGKARDRRRKAVDNGSRTP